VGFVIKKSECRLELSKLQTVIEKVDEQKKAMGLEEGTGKTTVD
jgi:hypothetical protein